MLQPPILNTSWIKLRLLEVSDIPALLNIAQDPDVWRWFTIDLSDQVRMEQWVAKLLTKYKKGEMIPLVIEDHKKGQLIGSSSYMNIAEEDLCLEIGTTWIGKAYHGTGVNYHMKYVMLKHAFETWNFERVEFRTDAINIRSRRAIEKIGATYEGTFRNHRFNKDGGRRDSVIYCILRQEWSDIKSKIFGHVQ